MVTTRTATCGNHIRAANAGVSKATRSAASRLVRLDTGRSRLAVLANHTVVMASGSAAIRARAASASMTGVSSTAVVSKFRNTVMTDANATHSKNSAA